MVVIVGLYVDLLILIIALKPSEKNIPLPREARGHIRKIIYSSKDLQLINIIKNLRETVLFVRAFSGSDTSSAFLEKANSKLNLLNSKTN